MLRPVILVAPAEHRFGAVHVERLQEVTLYLSNPSEVDAEWRIQHIPYIKPPKRVGTSPPKSAMMPEDDPSAFKFSKVAGVLPGPSMPLHVAQARLELLKPTHMVDYAMDIYREVHGEGAAIPKEMEEQKAGVFAELERLKEGAAKFDELCRNEEERVSSLHVILLSFLLT